MEEVLVLMSTYNGDKFLEEQLDTIFRQEGVSVSVLVRDDGSTDSTCDILEHWKSKNRLNYIRGDNVGAARSFFLLLKDAPPSDYYAFSDQDDIWYPFKLRRAVEAMGHQQAPLLYFANVDLTDSDGHLKQQSSPTTLNITKHNALIESFASGCTMVFNHSLRQIVCEHIPTENIYHDRWMFLSAMFLGQVVYDGNSCMGYRQHGGNQVGSQTQKEKGNIVKRLLKQGDFSMPLTAELFYHYYQQDISAADRQIVRTCADYKNKLWSKLRLMFHPDYQLADSGVARSVYWKVRILLNRL